MTEGELELKILQRFIAQHEAAATAGVGEDKCARELDMREVLRELTGKEGAALDYHADLWFKRLVERPSPEGAPAPLRPCSRGDKFRARAFIAGRSAPAWDRVQDLEARLGPSTSAPPRELEQKFRILWSPGQAAKDFAQWTDNSRSRNIPVGFLFVDIDNFKSMNTRFTETVVDQALLPGFQKLLEGIVRHRGHAYRQGGEEFLLLLPNHTLGETVEFAERLRQTIESRRFESAAQYISLTVSIGVAAFPDHGVDLVSVVQAANQAKLEAKTSGRNRVVVADTGGAGRP